MPSKPSDDPNQPPPSLPVRTVGVSPPLPGQGSPSGLALAALTLAFGLVILIGFMIAQGLIAGIWVGVVMMTADDSSSADLEKIATNGDLLGVASLVSGVVGLGLVWLFVWLLNRILQSPKLAEFLAFRGFRWWQVPIWIAIVYGMGLVHEHLAPMLGKDEIPQFMLDAYGSAKAPWLLWIAIGLMAPVFEEVLFRGFFYSGWRGERFVFWRAGLTMVITSIIWAAIHLQYGWFEIAWIFVFGILLCVARETSRSLWLPLIMHAFNNIMATIATAMHFAENPPG